MKRIGFFCLITLLAVTAFGQYARYDVSYQTFGNYNFAGKCVYVDSNTPGLIADDVEFVEYASVINQMLSKNGAIITDSKEDADVVIYALFEISGPQKKILSSPTVINHFKYLNMSVVHDNSETITEYTRLLDLKAYTTSNNKNVWKASASSIGESPNYIEVLPVMIYAISSCVGTTGNATVTCSESKVKKYFKK